MRARPLSLLAGLAAATLLSTPHLLSAAEPQFDVCSPQVASDIKARFGHDVERIDWAWDDGSSDNPESSVERGSAVAYVKQCDGYYWYEVFANEETCEYLPHYGNVPNYIFFRSVNGACETGGAS